MAEETKAVSTQPKSIVPMIAGGNKNALNCPLGPDQQREWSYGIFDCFAEVGTFFFACFCPCMVYSRTRQHLRSLQYQGTVLPAGSEQTDEHCCIYCGLVVCGCHGWVLNVRQREEIRERYGIRGNPWHDCLWSGCCRPCALTQEHREIMLEEANFESQAE